MNFRQVAMGLVLSALVLAGMTGWAERMTVSEAYRAIPHRQTSFSKSQAKMSEDEKNYLARLFDLADQAMVARVETMLWFQSGGRRGESYENYTRRVDGVLAALAQSSVPRRLRGVHNLIAEAVVDQKAYFAKWHEMQDMERRFDPRSGAVRSSHQKLIKAYNTLMQLYPRESPHNQQAFYDHLCALDFI